MDKRDFNEGPESFSLPKSSGQLLYERYFKIFNLVFAPRWHELSDISRSNWELLSKIKE